MSPILIFCLCAFLGPYSSVRKQGRRCFQTCLNLCRRKKPVKPTGNDDVGDDDDDQDDDSTSNNNDLTCGRTVSERHIQ